MIHDVAAAAGDGNHVYLVEASGFIMLVVSTPGQMQQGYHFRFLATSASHNWEDPIS